MEGYRAKRAALGLAPDARGDPVLEYAAGQAGLTPTQLAVFLERCKAKYKAKRIDPGAFVG